MYADAVRRAGLLEEEETLLMSATVRMKGQEQSVGLVVSNIAVYEIDGTDEVKRWDFKEIHSVHRLEKNIIRVFLLTVTHSKTSKERVKGWGVGETASNYLIPRDFICDAPEERDELFLVLRTCLVDVWQAYLECELESIPANEIYQCHLFLTKRNRKGKLQIRFVVVTDKKMYNFEARIVGRRIEPHKCKWAFPIADLQHVTTYADDPQAFSITVGTNASERKQVKNSMTYLVDNKTERALFIRELKRLYFQANQEELDEEQIVSRVPKKK